jgi:hypothetical protein
VEEVQLEHLRNPGSRRGEYQRYAPVVGREPVTILQEAGGGYAVGLNGHGKSRPHRDSIRGLSNPYRLAIPTKQSCSPHDMYRSSNMIWMIKRGMHDGRMRCMVRSRNPKERAHLGNLDVDGNNNKMDLREKG